MAKTKILLLILASMYAYQSQYFLNKDISIARGIINSHTILETTIVEILQHSPTNVLAIAKIKGSNASILVKIPRSDAKPSDHAVIKYLRQGYLDSQLAGYSKLKRLAARVEDVSLVSFEASSSMVGFLYQTRRQLSDFLSASLNYRSAALLTAIMWGDTDLLSRSIKDNFKEVGLSHVMAISGANMTLLAQIITLVFGFLSIRLRYLLIAILMLAFSALVGMSAAVLRATLMSLVSVVASISGQKYWGSRAFVAVIVVVFLVNPLIVFYDVGFQLSCVATASLLYLNPTVKQAFCFVRTKYVQELLSTTISITIGTLPIILYHFSVWYPLSLLVNVFLLPVFSLLSMVVYFLFILLLIPIIRDLMAVIVNTLLTYLLEIIHRLAELSSMVVLHSNISLSFLFLCYFIIVLIIVDQPQPGIISRVKSLVGKRKMTLPSVQEK